MISGHATSAARVSRLRCAERSSSIKGQRSLGNAARSTRARRTTAAGSVRDAASHRRAAASLAAGFRGTTRACIGVSRYGADRMPPIPHRTWRERHSGMSERWVERDLARRAAPCKAEELSLDGDPHPVSDDEAAELERGVPRESEVSPVDLRNRADGGTPGATGIRQPRESEHLQLHAPRHPAKTERAVYPKVARSGSLDAVRAVPDLRMALDVQKAEWSGTIAVRRRTGVAAGHVDPDIHRGRARVGGIHQERAGDAAETTSDCRDHQVSGREGDGRAARNEHPELERQRRCGTRHQSRWPLPRVCAPEPRSVALADWQPSRVGASGA